MDGWTDGGHTYDKRLNCMPSSTSWLGHKNHVAGVNDVIIGLKSGYQVNIFLFLHKTICCGYSLEVPHQGYSLEVPQQGTSNEYPQYMVLWRN